MTDLYKFVVDGDTIKWFEQEDDGSFKPEDLKLNQTLSFDPATGNVTLTSTYADYIRLEVFKQTANTADDATLYSEDAVTTFTKLDGTPITVGGGNDDNDDDNDSDDDDNIPDLNPRGGRHDLDDDGDDDDDVDGSDDDDDRSGGFGDDSISGRGGDDKLDGEDGDDSLSGDDGDDRLTGVRASTTSMAAVATTA